MLITIAKNGGKGNSFKIQREGGDTGYILHQSQKFYKDVFSLVGLTIWWLLVQTFLPLIVIYRRGSSCIIIGEIHPLCSHCLIPLDLWVNVFQLNPHDTITFPQTSAFLHIFVVQPPYS